MKQSWIKFADHYLKSGNATRAYMAAYPKCKTEGTAWTNGSLLLRKTEVAEYIKKKQEEIAKKEIIKKEDMLNDLKYIISLNIDRSPSVALKAYDLAAKVLGFNAPIETNNNVNIKQEQPLFGPLDNKKEDDEDNK